MERLLIIAVVLGGGIIAVASSLTAVGLLWLLDKWMDGEEDPEIERLLRPPHDDD